MAYISVSASHLLPKLHARLDKERDYIHRIEEIFVDTITKTRTHKRKIGWFKVERIPYTKEEACEHLEFIKSTGYNFFVDHADGEFKCCTTETGYSRTVDLIKELEVFIWTCGSI